ncbi:ABC-type amino acid transport substrate-binding protein [Streptomyces sp. V3I8]|uniref:transporter substrate-binding domain-containing protein n=1 Tax=Streptomyces sp. V3I8 TaxID=3042279 RepID=UPI002785048E|nr:ABC-type amino acid transport substrate-binding protein [Streptomyces sp. V3I8]
MKLRKVTAASATVLALALAATACGSDDKDDSDSSSSGGGNKKITIGIKFDQPGIGQKTPDGYAGFDVDVATYVAKQLGYGEDQIQWKEAKSADRETMLQRGDVDFIAASYSINDERAAKVDFAGPYLLAHQDVLVRADDKSIKAPEDLNSKKLCSVTGSTSAQNVKDKLAPKAQLQQYPSVLRVPDRSAERRHRRADHGRLDPRRLRRAVELQGQVQARPLQDDQRELRHRRQEGQRPQGQDQYGPGEDGLRQVVGQGRRGQLRPGRVQERARSADRQRRQVKRDPP